MSFYPLRITLERVLSFNTSLILALAAGIAAGVAAFVVDRKVRSIAVGLAVMLALFSLISVVRAAADNAALRPGSKRVRINLDP